MSSIHEFNYPNHFGLFDMHGNVWEWCLDNWFDDHQAAPSDGTARSKTENSYKRVLRGGSWKCESIQCRSSYRLPNNESDNLSNDIGFRIVRQISDFKLQLNQ